MFTKTTGITEKDVGMSNNTVQGSNGEIVTTHSGQVRTQLAAMSPLHLRSTFGNVSQELTEEENPTRLELQDELKLLESARYALTFSSGLAALTTTLSLLKKGQHVLCCDDVYGGTNRTFSKCAPPTGIETTFVQGTEILNWVNSFQVGKTKLVWIETPTNPTMKIIDIERVAIEIKKLDPECLVVVDNTFMTPIFQSPLKMGADIVLHSCTKYINGHSDAIMGALMFNDDDLYQQLKISRDELGIVPSAFDCWLVSRSIKTLKVRVRQQAQSAIRIAEFLENHRNIERVIYPGLKSHPQHALALKQYSGFGGMISIYLKSDSKREACRVLQKVKKFHSAVSLGCVCSLIELPSEMTHADLTKEEKAKLNVSDNLLRLSIGVENTDDLIEDLEQALEYAFETEQVKKTNGCNENSHRDLVEKASQSGTNTMHYTYNPVIPPLYFSTTFETIDPGNAAYEYSRCDNPTRTELQIQLKLLESAKYALTFSSDLGALRTISNILKKDQHILSSDDASSNVKKFFSKQLTRMGIETTFVQGTDVSSWANNFKSGETKMVWIETPSNPTMNIVDIEEVAREIKKLDPECLVVVDNTFMTPVFQSPLKMGADIVLHSCTNYINGHSDSVMGALMVNDDNIYKRLKFFQNALGIVPSAFDCWIVNRSIKTLEVRVRQQAESAMTIAKFLENHKNVERVIYPGLRSHPQHALALKQYSGFGGMISIYLKSGGKREAHRVLERVERFHSDVSPGYVCSSIEIPAEKTHIDLIKEEKVKLNISDNLLRLSIGLEEVDDLTKDLDQALNYAFENN